MGWNRKTEYDTNWEVFDYERWQAGEADVPVDYDVWPFTIPDDRLEDTDGELVLADES